MVTTLEHAKVVLTDTARFDFAVDVSRAGPAGRDAPAISSRSDYSTTPPLGGEVVEAGVEVFASQLAACAPALEDSASVVDVMALLRAPVARSTVATVLPRLDPECRDRVAELCLDWVDALGPVIAASRPPGRWSGARRRESAARLALEQRLLSLGEPSPAVVATVLAAGIQVPIAAGAWLLVHLAHDPRTADRLRELPHLERAAAWETIRVTPPTWFTARITRQPCRLGEVDLPDSAVVLVSPLLLGRSRRLVPGDGHETFDPRRWEDASVRPGAWLPFGAGPHACPGRSLGLAQLTHLAHWASGWQLSPAESVRVDQSRGLFPSPARLEFGAVPRLPAPSTARPQDPPS